MHIKFIQICNLLRDNIVYPLIERKVKDYAFYQFDYIMKKFYFY